MRNLIKLLILLGLSTTAYANLKDLDQQESRVINSLQNPGFENGKAKYTNTGSSTFSVTSTDAYLGKSGLWTASATGEFFRSAAVAVPRGLQGHSCLARFWYLADGISAGDITAKVTTGVADITAAVDLTPTNGTYANVDIGFICPASGNYVIELESTASGAVLLDQMHLGTDFRIGETAPELTALVTHADPVLSDFDSNTGLTGLSTNSYIKTRRVGDLLEFTYKFVFDGVGTASTTFGFRLQDWLAVNLGVSLITTDTIDLDIPASGVYVDTGAKILNAIVRQDIGDIIWLSDNDASSVLDGDHIGDTTNNFTALSGVVTLPILEWQNQGTSQTVTLETQGYLVNVDLGGSNTSLSASNVSTYTSISVGSLDLSLNDNSSAAQITCDGAVSTGTTCSGSSEDIGLTIEAPFSGLYDVCFNNLLLGFTLSSNDESARMTFRVFHTDETDTTDIKQGDQGEQYFAESETDSTNSKVVSGNVCGTFNINAGRNTFRLKYVANIGETPATQILADRAVGVNGERSINVTVRPLTQNFPQAIALTGFPEDTIVSQAPSSTTTSTTDVTVHSYLLPKGIWSVRGSVHFDCLTANTIEVDSGSLSISLTDNAEDREYMNMTGMYSTDIITSTPVRIVKAASPTNVYLIAKVSNNCSGAQFNALSNKLFLTKIGNL